MNTDGTTQKLPLIVSYGGGTDSTALIVEAHRRGIVPDAILFSDTGSEMPHTYEYLDVFDAWLQQAGFPLITRTRWTRRDGTFIPLHESSLQRGEMPSRAYGFSGCTSKWKQHPLDSWVAAQFPGRCERWVGYDATEGRRAANLRAKEVQDGHRWRAPLHEWGISRSACYKIIQGAGLPLPGKSSCWMCPSMKDDEVRNLKSMYPSLYAAAVQMEAAAMAHPNAAGRPKVRGLGMNLKPQRPWAQLETAPIGSFEIEEDEEESEGNTPCGCHD